MTKKNTKKNAFTLRILDSKIQSIFDDLLAAKTFGSKNILANKLIAASIENFAEKYLPGYKSTQSTEIKTTKSLGMESKTLKQLKGTADDTYVSLLIQERLLASLYNAKVLELQNVKVSAEEFSNGMLADLPEDFQEMKDELIKMRVRRMGVDDE